MRSQLFGFYIPSHHVYELLIPGALQHVCDLVIQHIRTFDGLAYQLENQYALVITPPYTQGFDIFLNEWDEETVMTVQRIMRDYARVDEFTRMQTLQDTLSWRWPKFRETAVAVQFLISATVNNETYMLLLAGWNDRAATTDIALADVFIHSLLRSLKQVGLLPAELLMCNTESESVKPYGARDDTIQKIQELRTSRRESIKGGQVTLKWTRGCQLAGITPSIVKKYDPDLHARWYDATF